jgi:hypothetical protein
MLRPPVWLAGAALHRAQPDLAETRPEEKEFDSQFGSGYHVDHENYQARGLE